MASSIMPVPRIWLSAPSSSQGQNAAVGHGMRSPLTASTIAKNRIENGKPNRKRILVAPQVPSGPVSDRCIALRATCPSAATMVKGIQSDAMENMQILWGFLGGTGGKEPHRAGRKPRGQSDRRMTGLRLATKSLSSLRTQGPIATGGNFPEDLCH